MFQKKWNVPVIFPGMKGGLYDAFKPKHKGLAVPIVSVLTHPIFA